MKIIVFGASGFIGSYLLPFLRKKGYEVIPYKRHQKLDTALVDVVINLSGEPVFGRWTKKKKQKIWDSRIEASKLLIDSMAKLPTPPKLYIGVSGVGYYGDRKEEILTEKSTPGFGFLANLTIELENLKASLKTRFVWLRLGVVLGRGGALAKMTPSIQCFLGRLGKGEQYVSWIAMEDVLSAVDFIIQNEELQGGINLTSPHPVTNATLTRTLGKALGRSYLFPIPKFLVKLLFGEGSEVYLNSVRVMPEKLQKAGFIFQVTDLDEVFFKKIFANK